MKLTLKNQEMNKGNQQFDDLLKVPDEAIIKSQQVEIGKLNAYIEELEYKLKEKPKEVKVKNYTYENRINGMNKEIKNKSDRISKLHLENEDLKEKIREYAYCERFLKDCDL